MCTLSTFHLICMLFFILLWLERCSQTYDDEQTHSQLRTRYYNVATLHNGIISVLKSSATVFRLFRVNSFGAKWREHLFSWFHYPNWLFRFLILTVWSEYINTQPKKWWVWKIFLYWCGDFFFTYEFWEFWEFWDLKIGIDFGPGNEGRKLQKRMSGSGNIVILYSNILKFSLSW